jgi:hypothetical protein
MTRGPDEAARMSERFVKGLGTSDDACGIHGCALVSHIFAACPGRSRIAILAGPIGFAASSVACAAARSPTMPRLQSVYGSYGVAGSAHRMNLG